MKRGQKTMRHFYCQSTNGIDFAGSRIDNKRIDDGDVFKSCDHELRFSHER